MAMSAEYCSKFEASTGNGDVFIWVKNSPKDVQTEREKYHQFEMQFVMLSYPKDRSN